jgi:NADPH:quinone reductase-like Zn-dependent oxidoreductase
MRAFTVPEFNAQGSITERPQPEPGPGQILVRVRAAGVNPMDQVVVGGWMAGMVEHRTPIVPGFDYAGEIEALGEGVTGLAVGDRVFGGVGKMVFGEGSWAEYVTAGAAIAHRMPDGISFEQAAAIPLAGGTAIALLDAADVSTGDTVLVVGAAGGVGSYVVQLAAMVGTHVIAATRAASMDYVRGLGAHEVVDSEGDLIGALRDLAPDGVDALIDTYHDAPSLAALAPIVRRNGWIVSPRAQGIDEALTGLPIQGALVSAALGRVGEIAAFVARGQVQVPIESVPLEDADRALAAIGSGAVRGKQVLTVD